LDVDARIEKLGLEELSINYYFKIIVDEGGTSADNSFKS
jgi:hypothetical protein